MTSPTIGTHRPRHNRSVSLTSIASAISPKSISTLLIPLAILLGIVIASAGQTEVAHHLTADLNYHQPYFSFFLTHIAFSLVFPTHLLILYITQSTPISSHLEALRHGIADQLDEPHAEWREISGRWSKKVIMLTLLVSVPALSWYVAINLTTGLSVTTIYASSSFWAYLFSMWLLKQPLSKVTVGSIGLAFAGVIVLSLGNAGADEGGAPNPLLGDLIMIFGAVILALYEVVYKLALPEGHGGVSSATDDAHSSIPYTSLPTHITDTVDNPSFTPPESRPVSPPIQGVYVSRRGPNEIPLAVRTLGRQTSSTHLLRVQSPLSPPPSDTSPPSPISIKHIQEDVPELPAALHANCLTSCIGFATLILLWIPIPILHWMGWEEFKLPGHDGGDVWTIWSCLMVVACSGAIYNAGLMVLIGIWGPTTSSVANLMAIGLIAILDAVWIGTVPSFQSLVGVGMICIGFGVLLWEGEE